MAFVGAFDARQTGGRRSLSPQYEEDTTLGGVHLQNLPTVESSGRGSGSLEIETSAPKPQLSIRKKMYLTLEKPSYSPLAKLISISMMLLILLSTVSFIMEGEVTVGNLPHDPWFYIFDIINTVSIFVFAVEYLLRILLCYRRVSFFFNLMNLVDLAAFLPGLVTFILKNADPDGAPRGFDGIAFLRVMRLVRVFRIFKFGKYSGGIQMFAGALRMSYKPLGVLVLILLIATVISASLLHMIERQLPSAEYLEYYLAANGFDDAKHDECFGTIVRGFWWAIVTMTTVGYGDCSPITAGGKVVGGVVCVGGIILIAMPITVIGSNFAKMVELFSDEMDNDYEVSATRPAVITPASRGIIPRLPRLPRLPPSSPPAAPPRQVDANNSGTIEELELREFLHNKKNANALRKDIDITIPSLMAEFDSSGEGILTYADFNRLQQHVLKPVSTSPTPELTSRESDERAWQLAAVEDALVDARGSQYYRALAPPFSCRRASTAQATKGEGEAAEVPESGG